MPPVPMIASVTSVELYPAPINPNWIREGTPQARCATLSRSSDRQASTLIWDCTAGQFVWHYDIDETIYILEGSVTISDGCGPAKIFTAGDVLFLPRGAICHWHVENYVRKVAFCRQTQPMLINIAIRALGRLQRIIRRVPATSKPLGLLEAA